MEEEEDEVRRVREFIRKQVGDWDDEVIAAARFKAFSGQRSDWEHKYLFWRQLIIDVARHLGLSIVRASQVKGVWFNRGGLTPLCLDQVLHEMCICGDLLQSSDLANPTRARLSQIFRRIVNLAGVFRTSALVDFSKDHLVLSTLMKDKAIKLIKDLSEYHWTTYCIVTMKKFQEMCGGSLEASAVLSHLSACGKARYLVINKDFIEGVKISLSSEAVSSMTSLDFDVLQLIWTSEKLQQQLHVIDQRCAMYRRSALASLKTGNRLVALTYARKLKLASQSREKCSTFLNRVEEVIGIIADAESSKKVSEAIKLGACAIKNNQISVEEVQLCLQELDENIDSLKQVEKVLDSSVLHVRIEDENIEDEFTKLELDFKCESSSVPISGQIDTSVRETNDMETILRNSVSNLRLTDGATTESASMVSSKPGTSSSSKDIKLEAA